MQSSREMNFCVDCQEMYFSFEGFAQSSKCRKLAFFDIHRFDWRACCLSALGMFQCLSFPVPSIVSFRSSTHYFSRWHVCVGICVSVDWSGCDDFAIVHFQSRRAEF